MTLMVHLAHVKHRQCFKRGESFGQIKGVHGANHCTLLPGFYGGPLRDAYLMVRMLYTSCIYD